MADAKKFGPMAEDKENGPTVDTKCKHTVDAKFFPRRRTKSSAACWKQASDPSYSVFKDVKEERTFPIQNCSVK